MVGNGGQRGWGRRITGLRDRLAECVSGLCLPVRDLRDAMCRTGEFRSPRDSFVSGLYIIGFVQLDVPLHFLLARLLRPIPPAMKPRDETTLHPR